MMNFEENQKHKDRPGAAEHAEGGSPLLELEDWAWASLLKIHSELKARLTGKEIKGSACKCQLQLLEEKKYDELETALIEKCKSVGFCLGDEIEGELRGLLKLATISSDPLIHKILTLIIRLAYQEGEL